MYERTEMLEVEKPQITNGQWCVTNLTNFCINRVAHSNEAEAIAFFDRCVKNGAKIVEKIDTSGHI